jgi:serine protease Do
VVGKDAKVDLAVLRVKPEKPLKSVKFGDSEKARLGDWVIAIGNPFGLGGSVTAGIVSARNRDISDNSYGQYIQTDAAINKGNSGGPLFNMQGEVIGVNTAILSPSGGSIGIGFSVPSGMAKPVIEQLIQYGETRRGWLGVRIQNVDDTIAESLGLGSARGALVADVDPKGPAKPAGIEAGDVIIKFDGHDVKDSKDLPRLVGQTAVGKTVDVVVLRKGKELTKTAKLERLAETDPQAKASSNKAPDVTLNRKFAGLELWPMNDELRKRYSIKDSVKGVVVTKVEPNSSAADKRIAIGDVITFDYVLPAGTQLQLQNYGTFASLGTPFTTTSSGTIGATGWSHGSWTATVAISSGGGLVFQGPAFNGWALDNVQINASIPEPASLGLLGLGGLLVARRRR